MSGSLRFLLDENLGIKVYEELRRMNLDVQSVISGRRGIGDLEIINIAKLHNKIIVTMDKDFGHLALSHGPLGVILLRLRDPRVPNRVKALLKAIELKEKLYGCLTVVTETSIRRRPFAPP
ncbi:MAG: DUF5615 family PIN-like protein [Candidatus Methanodesulfokora sp.]|nr:MAG: toxin-antitoxin system, toxin component [Candidatus Korarchaeota archaeon]